MASFEKAFNILEKWEGGYSNHFLDTGGETYKGITRKNYPNMSFWSIIDELKKERRSKNDIDIILLDNVDIQNEIKNFYKKYYWDIINCDEIENEDFATNLLLLSVNAGIKRAIKVGQEACKIVVDGIYGIKTREAFKVADYISVELFNLIEIKFYNSLVEKRPANRVFLNGWINRSNAI